MVKIADLDQFCADHPHLVRVYNPLVFSDRINIRKNIDGGFKEVLNKAKKAHPLGTINV